MVKKIVTPVEFVEELAPSSWIHHRLFEKSDIFSVVDGKKVLDVGSGTGVFVKLLLENGAKVDCLDLVQQNLDYIGKLFQHIGLIKGNAEHLPEIRENAYDIILCSSVVEHFKNPEKALRELVRILKPGGFIYITIGITPKLTGWLSKKTRLFQIKFVGPDDPNLHRKSKFSSKQFYFDWEMSVLEDEMKSYGMKLNKAELTGGALINCIDYIMVVLERLTRNADRISDAYISHNYRMESCLVQCYNRFILPYVKLLSKFDQLNVENSVCLMKYQKTVVR